MARYQVMSCRSNEGELRKPPTTRPTNPRATAPTTPWFSQPIKAPTAVAATMIDTDHTILMSETVRRMAVVFSCVMAKPVRFEAFVD